MSIKQESYEDSVPKKSLICVGDGDDVGDVIDFYLFSENLGEASKFSFQVKSTLEKIAELAKNEINASLVYVAGDDICFIVKSDINLLDTLTFYSDLFLKNTGRTSVEALISLRRAKVSGKGRVIAFGGS